MVLVTVSDGTLEGELVKHELGEYYSFKGIPFAAPPVGDLRFKAPQPVSPWTGVRSAKEYGPICFQSTVFESPPQFLGSEDCLYLNVFTPDVKPTKPLTVMVFIHGGAFVAGSGNDDWYGPEFLIKKEIVLVTLNYRVGALGFLCLGTEDIPGNAAMKDQVAALRWVKKNISNFGGESRNITIFGQSAGGGSVGYHLISPMTKGLFKRAIAMSGSATNSWAQSFEAREKALKLAKQLGFNSEDDKELYQFFKTVSPEKLVNINLPVVKSVFSELDFSIVSEKKFENTERFFFGDECDALRNGIHKGVEVMTGYTKDEGLMAFTGNMTFEQALEEANAYKEFFVPTPIRRRCNITQQLATGRKLQKFYIKKTVATTEDFDQLLKLFNLDLFVHGVILHGKFISKKEKVYMYKVTCITERNICAQMFNLGHLVKGREVVCHADDLLYLFPMKVTQLTVEKGSESEKLIDQFTTMWTNFAKFGNPTPDDSLGVKWTPFTIENQTYLEIGNKLQLKKNPEEEEIAAWDEVFRKYLPNWTVR